MNPSKVHNTPNENTGNLNNQQSQNTLPSDEEMKNLLFQEIQAWRSSALEHRQLNRKYSIEAEKASEETDRLKLKTLSDENKELMDYCNNHAVRCIMELHNLTHTDPDILDLHYLQVDEAIDCLDCFLDYHIKQLKSDKKDLFIITGRGLHSKGGHAKIKPEVQMRLEKRRLTWFEAYGNPGLLRVEISDISPT